MIAETENLMIERLRRPGSSEERTEADLCDLQLRTSALDAQVGALGSGLDRFNERLARIERRLDQFDL